MRGAPLLLHGVEDLPAAEASRLDTVFFALSDPLRRAMLERLDGTNLLVSELAEPFDVSLQAVSRHIQVLVRAGLVQQARSGRISRCSLDVAPIYSAAVWINRYSHYWQAQFEDLAQAIKRGSPKKNSAREQSPRTRRRSR